MTETAVSLPDIEDLLGQNGRLKRLLEGYEYRPQQIRAAHVIRTAIRENRTCIVEAGTGVGKTMAYLVPAAEAVAQGRKVVISTYTVNLQGQLIEKDIPLLQALVPEVPIKAWVLKGKNRYLCKQDLDAASGDLFHTMEPTFAQVRAWAARTATGDSAELDFVYPRWSEIAANQDTCRVRDCRYFDSCFYYAARRRALGANLLVVNHALLLTDIAARSESEDASGLLPRYDVLIVDEAHHLEEAATSALTCSLASWEVPALVERVQRLHPSGSLRPRLIYLADLAGRLFDIGSLRAQDFTVRDMLSERELEALVSTAMTLRAELLGLSEDLTREASRTEGPEQERLEGMQKAACRLADAVLAVMAPSAGRILWCEVRAASDRPMRRSQTERRQVLLHSSPIEVNELLNQVLWSATPCAVLTSATLATSDGFAYIRGRLGLPETSEGAAVGSPFDFRSQALLYVPAHLPPPPRDADDGYFEAVTAEIRRLLDLTEGRAFLLFTSRKALTAVYARLKELVSYRLFRQGDMPPERLLDLFRRSGNGVLLGNQTFWEGVDIQGEALSLVVIDRIPFAVPDSPITKARCEAVEQSGRDPFAEYSLPQAQIRLKQGFGRLIRTRTDRGIVCVLDSRLVSKSYGRAFVAALPPASRASTWERVERFWYG